MRTKATLFLLVLVAGLGAVAFYLRDYDTDEDFKNNRVYVLGSEAVDLDFLDIRISGEEPITLQKTEGRWNLTHPVSWPANVYAVNRLLNRLLSIKRDTSFPVSSLAENGQTLADFGLDPPQGELIYGRRGEQGKLLIGRATETSDRLFVMREGDSRIMVARDSLLRAVTVKLEEIRNSGVFSIPVADVNQWNVQLAESGNLRVWLAKEGDAWTLETPVRARASTAAVETLLGQMLALNVQSFLNNGRTDLNAIGLANPALTLTIEGPGTRESLLIGNRVTGSELPNLHYAKRENNPTLFTVEIGMVDELRNVQLGLRDRRLIDLDPATIQTITITPAGLSDILLQRLETGWQVVSREPGQGLTTNRGDNELISALVDQISQLKAAPERGFVSDAPSDPQLEEFGLKGRPNWLIKLTGQSDEQRPQTLLLGGRDSSGNLVYAKTGDAPFVFLVDRGLSDELSVEAHHYRDRQLQELPEGARITALKITPLKNPDEPVFSVSLPAGVTNWETALAGLSEEKRAATNSFIAQLRNLRAKRIVAASFTSTVPGTLDNRPWTWLVEATIVLRGGVELQDTVFKLYVDDYPGGPDLLAGVPDLNLVFETGPTFIDAFNPLVFTREDPGPPPAEAATPETPPGESAPTETDPAAPN